MIECCLVHNGIKVGEGSPDTPDRAPPCGLEAQEDSNRACMLCPLTTGPARS